VSAAFLLVPVFQKNYYLLDTLITFAIFIICVSGLRLILTTGHLSMAHAAFIGTGGYTTALLVTRLGWNSWACLLLAGICAMLVALPIGYLILRLRGAYFAICTLAIGEVFIFVWTYWRGIFGGSAGITRIPNLAPILGIKFTSPVEYYYLAILLAIITVIVMYRIDRSRLRLTLLSIFEAETLSNSLGVNTLHYKVMTFAVAAFFAGIAGGFSAHYSHYVTPTSYGFMASTMLIVYTIIGGADSAFGPVFASGVLTALAELLRGVHEYTNLALGVILIIVVRLAPAGIVGLRQQFSSWFGKSPTGGRSHT
jgi:branched-chain amino acid transport system permease protein